MIALAPQGDPLIILDRLFVIMGMLPAETSTASAPWLRARFAASKSNSPFNKFPSTPGTKLIHTGRSNPAAACRAACASLVLFIPSKKIRSTPQSDRISIHSLWCIRQSFSGGDRSGRNKCITGEMEPASGTVSALPVCVNASFARDTAARHNSIALVGRPGAPIKSI